jgi:hypothetical protein
MKKNVNADTKGFSCRIAFVIECSEIDSKKVVKHYDDLCLFYNIKGTIFLRPLMTEQMKFEHFWFVATIEKTPDDWHLNTVALRNIFLNDLEIIRQLHLLSDLEFHCPVLPSMLFS